MNRIDDLLLIVIEFERDQTLVHIDDLDIVLDEIDRIIHAFFIFQDLLLGKLYLDTRSFDERVTQIRLFVVIQWLTHRLLSHSQLF